MSKTIIKCTNIKKDYVNGDNITSVLKGVSFEIKEGEFVAIMGPSGSGKSTLMNILGTLDTPSSGSYQLNGKEVEKMNENELADIRLETIGFVFQSFNLLPRKSVFKNVALPLVYSKTPRKKRIKLVEKALESVALKKERWNHLATQLSGGQMQRVAIARSLVNKPKVILADEPTGNLDSKTGTIILKTFEQLNQEKNYTIILITHEEDIAKNAKRIIIIKDGVILSDKKQ